MAKPQPISGPDLERTVAMAAKLHTPATLTILHQTRWVSFRSRLHPVPDGGIGFAMPAACEQVTPAKVVPGQECNIHFQLHSYRYFFTSRDLALAKLPGEDGATIDGFRAPLPAQLMRADRRSRARVAPPTGQMVRAHIWADPEPKPIWSGSVMDLSTGGLQIRTAASALSFFMPGTAVHLEITFTPDTPPMDLPAHFRHGTPDGNMCLLGLEFDGLGTDETGKKALDIILSLLK
jgi:c-di-GMP-binding flagellar brake protein YcgR